MARIGICSFWFNRGQAVVGRHLRGVIDGLGHETFVLARPTRATNIKPSLIESSDVWDQPGVTNGSAFEIPAEEYVAWARENELDAAFFFANYQLDEIAAVRAAGVTTVGAFMWENFAPEQAEPAQRALDVIYCFSECDRERYAEMGIESPLVPWGCHPELDAITPSRRDGEVRLFYPGGYMTERKPLKPVVRAFRKSEDPRLRLVLKAQVIRKTGFVEKMAARDDRIEVIYDDLPTREHLQLFADCDALLAPSRWEGLGLHLFEATAFGMPIITNDNPPMNEVVEDELNGVLVRGFEDGQAPSGIPAYAPDQEELSWAIDQIADDARRARYAEGALEMKGRRSWDRTIAGVRDLLAHAGV